MKSQGISFQTKSGHPVIGGTLRVKSFFNPWMEMGGKHTVTCNKTGYNAAVDIIQMGQSIEPYDAFPIFVFHRFRYAKFLSVKLQLIFLSLI